MLNCLENPDNEKRFGKIGGHKNLIEHYEIDKCIDSYEFFRKHQNGDETAQNALKEYSRIIASVIINIQSILDAEKFCIGEGISAQDALIDEIRESLHEFIKFKSSEAINEPAIEMPFWKCIPCVGALYNFLRKKLSEIEFQIFISRNKVRDGVLVKCDSLQFFIFRKIFSINLEALIIDFSY